jgi:hypothetical protein
VHPTIAEQLVKAIERDRLDQAAEARLVREARKKQTASSVRS